MSEPICTEFGNHLGEILEEDPQGGISAASRARFLDHSASCAPCGELLRSYRSLLAKLQALPGQKAPDRFADAVMHRIEAEGKGMRTPPAEASPDPVVRRRWLFAAVVFKAAAFFAIGVIGWVMTARIMENNAARDAREVARVMDRAAVPEEREARRLPEAPAGVMTRKDALVLKLDGSQSDRESFDGRFLKEVPPAATAAPEDAVKRAVELAADSFSADPAGGEDRQQPGLGDQDRYVTELPAQSPEQMGELLAMVRTFAP